VATRVPRPVSRALTTVGEDVRAWRLLRQLTLEQVADRAGVSAATVRRLEHGQGASFENVLRVARALGVLDPVVRSFDPYESDVGRLRSADQLPQRIRRGQGAP
jgi:transcriptional regulator with XRE-family HTH domain